MRKILVAIVLISITALSPTLVLAREKTGITVTPTIIDERAQAKDILKYSVKIKNNTDKKVTIYAQVNDISEVDGRQEFLDPSKLNKRTSLARWIRFTRGAIDIDPGKEITEELKIMVNLAAVPGKRHAVLSLPQGGDTETAKKNALSANTPQLFINFEIVENIIEKAQLNNFRTGKNIYLEAPVEFSFSVNNAGNRPITPQGSIYVFNRRGQELAKLVANPKGESVEANGGIKDFNISWDSGAGLGKHKARLELEYGDKSTRDMQDVIYFWFLPKKILIIFLGSLFLLIGFLTYIIFKRTYKIRHSGNTTIKERDDGVLDLKNN